jgi:hypothetical protein
LPPPTRAERFADGDDGAKGKYAEESSAYLFVAYRQLRIGEADSFASCLAARCCCSWSSRRG